MPRGKKLYRTIRREMRSIKTDLANSGVGKFEISLCENREMYIEGALCVEKYDSGYVRLKVGKTGITVTGNGLLIGYFTRNILRISGSISNVEFDGGEKRE